MKLAVLGAGAWGTALSINLAARHGVTLWARSSAQAQAIAAHRQNERYLPGFTLPESLTVTGELKGALTGAEVILVAVTTAGLREILQQLATIQELPPVVWLCKGFDAATGQLPHQIARAELPPTLSRAVLLGPSFAEEVARGLPTALTIASEDSAFAVRLAQELHHERLRIYSSADVVGVEVAAAVKNVMAIAAGISDGLGLGYNGRAALMTRGLAEITRLGLKLGGHIETFMGLAGVGDLVLTCTGDLSRNRNVGLGLAQGLTLTSILGDLGHAAEGVYTARVVDRLAHELNVEMPITRAVCRVMDEGAAPRAVVQALLARDAKPEQS
jgi:glycerol-3-phosphate dehydrogenase (NAD(P)+)